MELGGRGATKQLSFDLFLINSVVVISADFGSDPLVWGLWSVVDSEMGCGSSIIWWV